MIAETSKVLVENLTNKVNKMIEWELFENLNRLMNELTEIENRKDFSQDEKQQIQLLKNRLEKRIIELVKKRATNTQENWCDSFTDLATLRDTRDTFYQLASQAATKKLKDAFWTSATILRKMLEEKSEQMAKKFISAIEDSFSTAEKLLTNALCTEEDVRVIDANLDCVAHTTNKLQRIPHIKHAGLPKILKNRKISFENFCDELHQRLRSAKIALERIEKRQS